MAKELPYFRFTVAEWLNGDISDEIYKLKGLFIDICAYYWFKDCILSNEKLSKHFPDSEHLLEELKNSEIFKVDDADFVHISFLDEQYQKASKISSIRSKCGKMKGLPKKQKLSKSKANAEQKHIYKDKDKDKDKDKEIPQLFLEVAKHLKKRILETTQKKITDTDIHKWGNIVRLMKERDNRKIEEIHTLINECHDMQPSKSGFTWRNNILSMGTLRRQWNEGNIYIGMNKSNKQEVTYGYGKDLD